MEDLAEIVNPDDKDYYNGKLYVVSVWCGVGYVLDQFKVYGDDNMEAILEKVVAYAEEHNQDILLNPDEVMEEVDRDFSAEYQEYLEENPYGDEVSFATDYLELLYVDATMEGASQPYYIRTENLRIKEIK